MIGDPIRGLEEAMLEMNQYMHRRNRTVFGRYPLMFSLIGTFAVAMVIYGFEHVLDHTVFEEHPSLSLLAGLMLLVLLGSLYKRIEKKIE